MVPFRLRVLLVALAAVPLCGCQQDEIRTYQVSKTEMTRLLGAILPHEDSTWFFKVSGPATAVGAREAEFTAFLRSLSLTGPADRPLAWKLPAGWEIEKADRPNRYATIRIGAKDALELTITKLGREGQAASLLTNINRWRNQLALPAVTQEELRNETKVVKTEAGDITVVDFTGAGSGKTGGAAPFAGGDRMPPAAVKEQKADLGYRLPEGWKKAPSDGISKAAFEVRDGQQSAKVTITPLGGNAGGLEKNVNRWRTQVGLKEVNDEEVRKLVQPITIEGKDGHYVDLAGAARRILAVVAVRADTTWFVKMDGPVDLVGKQKANFEAFVRSLRFDGGPGGNDG